MFYTKICQQLSLKASRAENGFYLYFRREIVSKEGTGVEEEIRKRIENGTFTDDDVVSLMCWQLSLPGEEMDCALIDECDRYLSRDAAELSDADRERMWRQMLVRISGGDAQARSETARHRRISRRRAAACCCCWRCWRWPSAAWPIRRRGVLNLRRILFADGQSGGRGAACDQR